MAASLYVDSEFTLHTFSRDKNFKKRLDEAVRTVLWEARNLESEDIRNIVANDPRSAYRAVHNSMYRKLIGGNVNILTQSKKLRGGNAIPPISNRYGNITGPIRGRMRKTTDFYKYRGPDRGMILRWLNSGTDERYTTNMDGRRINIAERERIREKRNGWHNKSKGEKFKYAKIGGRGGAATIHTNTLGMFSNTIDANMQKALDHLMVLIDKIIVEMF